MTRSNGRFRGTTEVHMFGIGRSGTSWLMKIFDHHPNLLALHEPEGPLRAEVGRLKRQYNTQRMADEHAARHHHHRAVRHLLFKRRPLRAVRKRPIVRKAYRSRFAHMCRTSIIYAASGLKKFGPGRVSKALTSFDIPDLGGSPSHILVKSVSRMNNLESYVQANPDLHIILMVRHPCANVSSILAGQAAGLMSWAYRPPQNLITRYFHDDRNGDLIKRSDLTMTEVLAIRWAVYNQMMQDLEKKYANVSLVVYEDLCDDPIEVSKHLFTKVDLPWHSNVEHFIQASLTSGGAGDGYHSVIRDPAATKEKWRGQLSLEDQETILRITSEVSVGRLFANNASDTTYAET